MSQFEQNFSFPHLHVIPQLFSLGKDSLREEDGFGDCTPQTKTLRSYPSQTYISKSKLEENHHIQHFAS